MTASELLARPEGLGRAPETAGPGPAERVLLVDDRADNLVALEAVLEPLGLDLLTAASGLEALHLLLDAPVAAIILDVLMPDMDGFEVAALLRSRSATRTVPILFLTAVAHSLDYEIRGYEAGGMAYICKPFEPAVLRARLRTLLDWAAEVRSRRPQTAPRADRQADHGPYPPRGAGADAGAHASAEAAARARRNGRGGFETLQRLLDLSVDPEPHGPAQIRAAVRAALRDSATSVVDTVELLVSELVTNAVVHGRTVCRLRLDAGATLIRVEVEDRLSRLPTMLPLSAGTENGRGLHLVCDLASRCGWTALAAGKSVWFELDLAL